MNTSQTNLILPEKIKKIGLRKAVDNHCRDCIYDEQEIGTWRAQVELCTAIDCDLFLFRPLPIKKKA